MFKAQCLLNYKLIVKLELIDQMVGSMDKELLGELLIRSLAKYNFKNYGKKLFYLDLKDSIIILEQLTYMS